MQKHNYHYLFIYLLAVEQYTEENRSVAFQV